MSVTSDSPRSGTAESTAWALLGAMVPGSRRKIRAIALAALLSTGFESLVLLLVVGSAVQPADDTGAGGLVDVLNRGSGAARASVTIAACLALLIVHVVGTSLMSRLARDVVRTTRDAAVDRYLRAPWSVQQQEGEGRLQETTSSLCTLSSNAGIALAGEIAGLIGLLVLLTASVAVDPVSTAVVIAIGTTIFLALRPLARATQSNATQFVLGNAEYNEDVTRVASMARELRAFGVTDVARSRLSDRNTDVADHLRIMRFTTRLGTDLYRDLALLALAALISIVVVAREELVVGFTAVLVLSIRALSYASTFQANRQTLREQVPNLVELDRRLTQLEPETRAGTLVPDGFDEIRFEATSYRYPDGRDALRETSFTLRRGDMMVVTGPSGAGKSTLLDILSGLRSPTGGDVAIDGHPLADLDPSFWTRVVGFVPQEPSLLPATVRENITFFRTGYSDDDVLRATRDASVFDDIQRLPDGLDTRLGPRGVGLSGGQKQRVAIARALLDEPALLLLDEPSSALDRDAQLAVEATFGRLKGSVTIVLVTHRDVLGDVEADHRLALRSPHD